CVKGGERHGPGRSVGILCAARRLVEHRGGRGWDVGAGAEREEKNDDETAHQRWLSESGAASACVTSSRGGGWVAGDGRGAASCRSSSCASRSPWQTTSTSRWWKVQ